MVSTRARGARKRPREAGPSVPLADARRWVGEAGRVLAVSGSGISAASGLSTFSGGGRPGAGLYARAQRALGSGAGDAAGGYGVFKHATFARRPAEASKVYEEIRREVVRKGRPTATHRALAALAAAGKLRAHVTLNVDGLHRQAHAAEASEATLDAALRVPRGGGLLPSGEEAVEMHGCILEAVCTACGDVAPVGAGLAREFSAGRQPGVRCAACSAQGTVRHGIMLYGTPDAEARLVLRGADPLAQLVSGASEADLILWLGISFAQSASVDYFCRAHGAASAAPPRHVIVGPQADDCLHNLLSAGADVLAGNVYALACTSDDLLAPFAPPQTPP